MTAIQIGFRAFDPHELLCHFVAERAGLYRDAGIEPTLLDLTFIADDDLPHSVVQVSCGAALMAALKGQPQRVLFVATDRPMFWLFGSAACATLQDLKGKRVASFPPVAPPWHFGRMILQRAGVEPDAEVMFLPARDDTARLGLLRSGSVDAAVTSSAIPVRRLEQRGFRNLCFFGDQVRVPTTGLAARGDFLKRQPELVSAVVHTLQGGLRLLHSDAELVSTVLNECFDFAADEANDAAVRLRSCFTDDGRTSGEIAQQAIDRMAASLQIADSVGWDRLYDFSLL